MSGNWLRVSLAAVLVAGCTANAPATPPPGATPGATPLATPAPTSIPTSSPTITSTTAPATAEPGSSPTGWPDRVTVNESGQVTAGDHEVPGYLAYLPPGYEDEDSPKPLLVFLHGAGEGGDGREADLRRVLKLGIPRMIADGNWPGEHPFIVLMPQYSQTVAEGDCALADDISVLIVYARLTYRIDPQRIYLTGISCGAIGVWDYLAEVEDSRVAAAVPIAGHPVWAIEKAGCNVARVPTWTFHGAQDEVVPVEYVEDSIADLRDCTDPPPSELELTIYPDADHFESDAWSSTYDLSAGNDIYEWLLSHRLGD